MLEQRPLDGFVFAVTPFNFTSIAGNLPTAPALMGNTVVWKPASSSVFSGHYIMQILKEAGMPDGVINFVPGSGGQIGNPVMASPTWPASTSPAAPRCSRACGSRSANNIHNYGCYPRIVGETGGKDFIFAHPSADVDALVTAMVRGAFEYQGQKCSGRQPGLHPRQPLERDQEEAAGPGRDHQDGGRHRLPHLHGRGDRPGRLRRPSPATSTAPRARKPAARPRSSPAASATTGRATSSSPRSSTRPTPITRPWSRRSSARCSRSTSTRRRIFRRR